MYCFELDGGHANKMYCQACYERFHANKKHTVERVNKDPSYGLHILTPLFDEMLFVAIFWYAAYNVVIERDYFVGKMYCPVTLEVRGWMSAIDLGYVTYYKAGFLASCGKEDSFIRFYGDAWLRSIVVGNDNMVGIFGGYFPAVAADVMLTKLGIPIIARIFSAFFTIAWVIERCLPRTGFVARCLEELSDSLNFFDFIDETPLATEWRAAGSQTGNIIYDTYDRFNYPYMSFMRVPNYFFNRIKKQMKNVVYRSRVFVTFIRVMCVFFGVRGMLAVSAVAFPLWLLRQHVKRSFKDGKTLDANVQLVMKETLGINVMNLVQVSFRSLVLALAAGAAVAWLAVTTYQEHAEMFKHIRPGTEISEEIFWSGFQFIFRLSRTAVVTLLTRFFIVAAICLGVGSTYMFSRVMLKEKKA